MDEEVADARHPYHQLYDMDLHNGNQEQGKDEVEEDDEEDDEDDNMDDDEDDDEGAQERQECEQDFELDHSQKRSANTTNANGNLLSNATSAHALVFYPADTACPSVRIEAGGDGAEAAGGGDETRRENFVVGGFSGRDDWTEGATHVLLEVWGDRYMSLNKGNLKQEDWEEVAEVVSSMSKTQKTDVQCKNRLDTLKKKYKVERHKQSVIGSLDSKWPFYKRLDQLLSATVKRAGIPGGVDAGVPVKSSIDREDSNRPAGRKNEEEDFKIRNNTSTSSKSKDSAEMTYSSPHDACHATDGAQTSRKRKSMDSSFKTLAKAIARFGEIYEKIEQSKQQQIMDLEKIRMEFTRDLELQRMQLFMQTQVELAKMKNGTSEMVPTLSNLSQ